MEKTLHFYFIYFLFCHFNTDSHFILSSFLISSAEEESQSQSSAGEKSYSRQLYTDDNLESAGQRWISLTTNSTLGVLVKVTKEVTGP